jgi:hypothetical protein
MSVEALLTLLELLHPIFKLFDFLVFLGERLGHHGVWLGCWDTLHIHGVHDMCLLIWSSLKSLGWTGELMLLEADTILIPD